MFLLKPNSKIKIEFIKTEDEETQASLKVDDDEFIAKSKNKCQAKLKAFKEAVRHYDTDKTITFF